MKKHLPFIFAFVFLVAFSLAWPTICKSNNASSAASSSSTSHAKTESTSGQTSIQKLGNSANAFYQELLRLDSLGEFAVFQTDGKFRIELALIDNEDLIIETTNAFNSAKEVVEDFCEENIGQLKYDKLIEDDALKSLLNDLNAKILILFGLA